VFISLEATDDPFTDGVSGWRPYKQEIVMANVLTGELRRLAHHRSRGLGGSYFYQPRVSVSWDGARVAWASNFGYEGPDYADIYAIEVGQAASPLPTIGTPAVSFTNPVPDATLSGTATVTIAVTGGAGTGYTYKLAVDGANVYAGSNNTVGWNTTNVSNGAHRLTATVTDSSGQSSVGSQSVTVSNVAVVPAEGLVASLTTRKPRARLSGAVTVRMTASNSTASKRTFTLLQDGVRIWSKTTTAATASWVWDTASSTVNGSHTLKLRVTDSDGNSDTSSIKVRVAN
jgi:hypothetical protein